MSQSTRLHLDRLAPVPLGAVEITSFAGWPVNDNGPGSPRPPLRVRLGLSLPSVAFICGVTAALLVTGLTQLLGLNG